MASLAGFNAAEVDPQKVLSPIPVGDYKVAISASEMKATSNGKGTYLALTFDVLDGEYKGRKLYSNLNLTNPNAQTVEIAKGELSAICRAVAVLTPNDSAELHNRPLVATVKLEKRKDTGDLKNVIKGYSSLAAAAQTTAPSGNDKPW